MARVLLAWELGANFGHLVSMRAIAQVLRKDGHECFFAVRQLGPAFEFLEPSLGPVYQAPVRLSTGRNPVKTQVSYTSLLHNTAGDDVAEAAGRIRAWRELLQLLRIDAVVAEHSPVAMVAARSLALPLACVGSGFTVPPAVQPFPSFQPDLKFPAEVLGHNDAEVLKELNRSLALLKLAPLPSLQALFGDALPGLLTYAEIDHYPGPRPEPYLGMPDYSYGEPPVWPEGEGPRIFAYLRQSQWLAPMLSVLSRSRTRVLVRVAGVPPSKFAKVLRPGMSVVEKPLHFRAAAESCDAFVNYGAHSTVAEFLLAGKPGLLVPEVHEQVLTVRRVVELGAGVGVSHKAPQEFAAGLKQALDRKTRTAAQRFAARYASMDRAKILPAFVRRLLPPATSAKAPSREPSARA